MNQYAARALRLGLIVAFSLSASLTVSDARAVLPILPPQSTCGLPTPCIFATNTATGPALQGTAASGFGVAGLSTSGFAVSGVSKTNDGVVGITAQNAVTPGTGKAGVSGYDKSTNKNTFNSGIYGVSHYGDGVQGRSTDGTGVNGQALGIGTGVYGSALGAGAGISAAALGGSASSTDAESGTALLATTAVGGIGLRITTDSVANIATGIGATVASGQDGLIVQPDKTGNGFTGLAVYGDMGPRHCCARAAQGAIVSGYNGMSVTGSAIGLSVSGGQGSAGAGYYGSAIYAQSGAPGSALLQGATTAGKTVALLDDSGNLTLTGKVTQHGTFTSTLLNRDGTYSTTYSPHTTLPSVEDIGEANLVGGAAYIPIDSVLAKSIDVARGYLVFLTPQGATAGLYVTGKTGSGFSVREIGAARSSLAFDYRIVARPYSENGQRLAPVSASFGLPATHAPMFYRRPTKLGFRRGSLDRSTLPGPSM